METRNNRGGLSAVVAGTTATTTNNHNAAAGDVPSGFILKLFQMVNGAPNEVISVSCLATYKGRDHTYGKKVISSLGKGIRTVYSFELFVVLCVGSKGTREASSLPFDRTIVLRK